MSHYYTRNCDVHGEVDVDADFPTAYCPLCGDTREKEIAALRAEVERHRAHECECAALRVEVAGLNQEGHNLHAKMRELDENYAVLSEDFERELRGRRKAEAEAAALRAEVEHVKANRDWWVEACKLAWEHRDRASSLLAFEEKETVALRAEVEKLRKADRALVIAERGAEARAEKYKTAILWALGEGDSDFGDNAPPNAPRYWWRSELRRRAALREGEGHE